MYNVIGLTGVAQAGKDTAAQVLIEKHGFRRIAFADTLRKILLKLNPIIKTAHGNSYYRLADIVGTVGWEAAKRDYEVRTLLQRLGTEAGREILGENIWVNTALKDVKRGEKIVITDVRFDNEARAIRSMEGIVIRINREGFCPVNAHQSDQGISHNLIDGTVYNNYDIWSLHRTIELMVTA